jgi:hypothetical protein
MEKGDLVKLNLTGQVVLGMTTPDADMYGTGVFLGWVCDGQVDVADIYWLGGMGRFAVPKKYFQQIT